MKSGRKRPVFWATGVAMACLLGVVSARQAGPDEAPLVSENVFRDIQVLQGMPVDTFFDVMGMFASSMGDDCTYCHSADAVFRHEAFGDPTPRIQRARQMVVMVRALNDTYFGGAPRVTCFTCHRGMYAPVDAPLLSLQYGVPVEEPNVRDFPPEPGTSADGILDKYLQALGGAEQLAGVSSFVASGTYAGFDTGFSEVPVEVFARAPNQRSLAVHMFNGDSHRVFDGINGWWAGPDSPVPIETLTSGNLDRYRLEALVALPAGIKQAFSQWTVGRTAIDDLEVMIVQGVNPDSGLLPVNFYFDVETGLLVRWVRWNGTPLGPVPTQVDYSDYRDVAETGIKMPFTWTVSKTYMQHTVRLSDLQANVPVDATRFARPAPGTPKL
jgi:photosynthetic reaction center cytochrome c subunit